MVQKIDQMDDEELEAIMKEIINVVEKVRELKQKQEKDHKYDVADTLGYTNELLNQAFDEVQQLW